jgi:hypothetical protein
MRFGLFNSAEAGGNGGQGYHQYTDYNIEAEALGYYSSFLVEHHFSGWSQVSSTLQLLNWVCGADDSAAGRLRGHGAAVAQPRAARRTSGDVEHGGFAAAARALDRGH